LRAILNYKTQLKISVIKKICPVITVLSQLVLSCKKDLTISGKHNPSEGFNRPLKVAIGSDIYFVDPSLPGSESAEGAAFQNYLNQDLKLLHYSDPISER
jgi:hypothetical protein